MQTTTHKPQTARDISIAPPLPNELNMERIILGAVIVDDRKLETAKEKLHAKDFFLPQHRVIFKRMLEMSEAQQGIDPITLPEALRSSGELEEAGGDAYLSQLTDGMPRVSNVAHYARIVQKKAALRAAIYLGESIREQGFLGEIPGDDVLERLRALRDFNGCDWRTMFHTADDFKNAKPLRFAIDNFLQLDGATLFGGLSGHGKTFVMLSVVKALLSGEKLFGHFDVTDIAPRVIYLIPESTLSPFGHRLKLFHLEPFLENERLLVRTLSMGSTPCLADPRILAAAKGCDVLLDTTVRFLPEGSDENSASDNQRGLAKDIFALLGAGARSVVGAHHSAKAFINQNAVTLENVLRGTGDVGAMVCACYGIKQVDAIQNTIHIECPKARDFQPVEPFQIQGRPYIDDNGDFLMLKKPGECGRLADEQPEVNRGGASSEVRGIRKSNVEHVRNWLAQDPNLTSQQLIRRFADIGITVADGTIRKYRLEAKA